jgi:hypothetical protein
MPNPERAAPEVALSMIHPDSGSRTEQRKTALMQCMFIFAIRQLRHDWQKSGH